MKHDLFPELNFTPVFKSLMHIRGIVTVEEVNGLLNPNLGELKDPRMMKGMQDACARIADAIEKGEKIGVFTDYDVDGVCSAALLHRFLIKIGSQPPVIFIPDRTTDGYGLNVRGIDELYSKGVTLLITADCGTTAIQEIQHAKSLGMDVVITDHHEPGDTRPDGVGMINPKQSDCPFFGEDLCGAGVVFHLMVALRALLRERGWDNLPNLKNDLDLVAMATVSDVVSLSGINRILVKEGLQVLNSLGHTGIIALAKVAGIRREVLARDIGFILGPRINAAGRVADARKAFDLLTVEDADQARLIAQELHQLNRQRQSTEQRVIREAISMIEQRAQIGNILVVAGTNWHTGVVGIVASRLAERFARPAIVISIADGIGRGSGRSVAGIDLYAVLSRAKHYLKDFGGHKMAVGLTVEAEKILPFANAIDETIAQAIHTKPEQIEVDLKITPLDLSPNLLAELEMLAPFGEGNPEPVFLLPAAEVVGKNRIDGNLVKFKFKHSGRVFNTMNCYLTEDLRDVPRFLDVAFTPVKRRINGHTYLYLALRALSPV